MPRLREQRVSQGDGSYRVADVAQPADELTKTSGSGVLEPDELAPTLLNDVFRHGCRHTGWREIGKNSTAALSAAAEDYSRVTSVSTTGRRDQMRCEAFFSVRATAFLTAVSSLRSSALRSSTASSASSAR